MIGARTRAIGDEALVGGAEEGDGVDDGGGDVAQEQHQGGQQALHGGGGVGACVFQPIVDGISG